MWTGGYDEWTNNFYVPGGDDARKSPGLPVGSGVLADALEGCPLPGTLVSVTFFFTRRPPRPSPNRDP